MDRCLKYIVMVLLFSPVCAFAQPTISSINDNTLTHGQTGVIISGSGFGAKSSAAPRVWDDCSGTDILTLWDDYHPRVGNTGACDGGSISSTYAANYRTPEQVATSRGYGVALPHSNVTKYLCGAHYISGDCGTEYGTVMVAKARSISSFPAYTYSSWYFRIDSSFDYTGRANFKLFSVGGGNDGYSVPNWYHQYRGSSPFLINSTTTTLPTEWGDDASCLFQQSSYSGPCSSYQCGDISDIDCKGNLLGGSDPSCTTTRNAHLGTWNSGLNPGSQWIKVEIEITHSNDNNIGWIKYYENGVQKYDWHGANANCFSLPRSITEGIGGFFSGAGGYETYPNNWRYYSDIYLDSTLQRVMICTGSTWATRGLCEVQIPTAWNNTSVTVTSNQGAHPDSTTRYLYVVDDSGSASSGYSVTFNESETISSITGLTITGGSVQ